MNYKIEINKNKSKGYTISIVFDDGLYRYESYADTKKQANEWEKNNKEFLEKMRKGLTGR